MRTKEIVEKYDKLGLYVPISFTDWRGHWNPDNCSYECSDCGANNKGVGVNTMDWGEEDVCYRCFIRGWKHKYFYTEGDLTITQVYELFEKFKKEVGE